MLFYVVQFQYPYEQKEGLDSLWRHMAFLCTLIISQLYLNAESPSQLPSCLQTRLNIGIFFHLVCLVSVSIQREMYSHIISERLKLFLNQVTEGSSGSREVGSLMWSLYYQLHLSKYLTFRNSAIPSSLNYISLCYSSSWRLHSEIGTPLWDTLHTQEHILRVLIIWILDKHILHFPPTYHHTFV